MEVMVLDAKNPPPKPVLAIHAGSVRRQARLEVNQPFIIPLPGSQAGPVEVSLFQQLASQLLPDDREQEATCCIPVRRPDGSQAQLKLQVRRSGNKPDVNAQVATATSSCSKDPLGMTREYLDHHQLQQRIQTLIQDVLKEQPDDPYRYMLDQLKKCKFPGAIPFPATTVAAATAAATAADAAAAATAAAAASSVSASAPAVIGSLTSSQFQSAETGQEQPCLPQPTPKQPHGTPKPGRPLAGARSIVPAKAVVEHAPPCVPESFEIQMGNKGRDPVTQLQKEARAVVLFVLKNDLCSAAAEESMREEARKCRSRALAGSIVGKIRAKLMREEQFGVDLREVARCSMKMALRGSVLLLSPAYNFALTKWTVHVALRGAYNLLGKDVGVTPKRRESIPTPIVFLEGAGSNWSSWCK